LSNESFAVLKDRVYNICIIILDPLISRRGATLGLFLDYRVER